MMFEDKKGNIYTAEQVDMMSFWEIEEKGIHIATSSEDYF